MMTSDRSRVAQIFLNLFSTIIIVAQILRVVQISENLRYFSFSELQVKYGIVKLGDPVAVQCSAESHNGGRQYLPLNSAGSPALFVADSGNVTLYPMITVLQATRIKVRTACSITTVASCK